MKNRQKVEKNWKFKEKHAEVNKKYKKQTVKYSQGYKQNKQKEETRTQKHKWVD